jgi:hypothetical protein
MTSPPENWRPTAELLAAYFDGECEGRDDLSLLKQRIEDWLCANPQAQEELASHRRLLQLWQETTPPEPHPEQWTLLLARLEDEKVAGRQGDKVTPRHSVWSTRQIVGLSSALAAVVAGLAIYLGWNAREETTGPAVIVQGQHQDPARPGDSIVSAEDEIFPVADASEVTIVRVEGADTHTLVVGELPLQGILELVAPGDIILTLIRPAADTEINPVRLIESSSPMIWARLETETDD